MFHRLSVAGLMALSWLPIGSAAVAQGDLLVAPTRLMLENGVGSEVVVSNSGQRTSSYRISLILRRMDPTGQIKPVDEAQATPAETAALEMINFAPRKITLAPGQAQTVRIGVRPPPALPSGEYRAHLLFRAIPDAADAPPPDAPQPAADGMSIQLTPIYGVVIPIIVRFGTVKGEATLLSAKVDTVDGRSGVTVDIGRSGQRSAYGSVELVAPAAAKPLAQVKGIAVYPELDRRSVFVPVDQRLLAASRAGLTARFVETSSAGQVSSTEAPVR
jgi:hypothetical protein